jgi:hypothetical protein
MSRTQILLVVLLILVDALLIAAGSSLAALASPGTGWVVPTAVGIPTGVVVGLGSGYAVMAITKERR